MRKSINLSDAVLDYVVDVGVREHPVLKSCREKTAAMGGISVMQIAPEQGAFMAMTAQLMNAKRYIAESGSTRTVFPAQGGQQSGDCGQ